MQEMSNLKFWLIIIAALAIYILDMKLNPKSEPHDCTYGYVTRDC